MWKIFSIYCDLNANGSRGKTFCFPYARYRSTTVKLKRHTHTQTTRYTATKHKTRTAGVRESSVIRPERDESDVPVFFDARGSVFITESNTKYGLRGTTSVAKATCDITTQGVCVCDNNKIHYARKS